MRRALLRVGRYARVVAQLTRAAVKIAGPFDRWPADRKRDEIRFWAEGTLGIFGFDVMVRGVPHGEPGPTLFVANHTSWLDVYALLSQVDVVFVAKSDVRRWPIVGWLAARTGTVFIDRRRTPTLKAHIETMTARLLSGCSVAVFPEGTTTDGTCLLTFNSASFEAAVKASATVQPVAIRYVRHNRTRVEEAAFTGETTLLQSFHRLIDCRDCVAEITFLSPISPADANRRDLAQRAERAIRAHLNLVPDRCCHIVECNAQIQVAA